MTGPIVELRDALRIEDTRLRDEVDVIADRIRGWQLGVPIVLSEEVFWRRYRGEWRLMETGTNVQLIDTGRMMRLRFLELVAEHSIEKLVEDALRTHLERRLKITTKALSAPEAD